MRLWQAFIWAIVVVLIIVFGLIGINLLLDFLIASIGLAWTAGAALGIIVIPFLTLMIWLESQ